MTKRKVIEIHLQVDGDSPVAFFYTGGRFFHRYRCPIYATAERKRRFIERVAKAQMALCRTMEE